MLEFNYNKDYDWFQLQQRPGLSLISTKTMFEFITTTTMLEFNYNNDYDWV